MEHENDGDTVLTGMFGTLPKILVKEFEDLELRGRVDTF